jgi:DNA-binding NarL/FixJ family response regulator
MTRNLLADNHSVVLSGSKALLEGAVYMVVDKVRTEKRRWRQWKHQPDLLLIDAAMPKFGGMEVIRKLRATGSMPIHPHHKQL